MCGIIGYIGNKKSIPILLNGLKRLEYRGYDSCGIGGLNKLENGNYKLVIKKNTGKLNEVIEKENFNEINSNIGIAHNRWATHGGITKENAHPHINSDNTIGVVHNGIISNYLELKNKLIKNGHKFKSETDTEIIPHLIEEELKKYNNYTKKEYINAIKNALNKIDGTYGLVIINSKFPNLLIGAKKESPLILGISENEYYLGSDLSAFIEYTKNIVPLEDNDLVIIEKNNNNNSIKYNIINNENNVTENRNIITVNWNIEDAEKEGYDHFMLKEIMEEPVVINNSLKISSSEINKLAKEIKNCNKIYIVAMGTSLHAGMIAEYWFAKYGKLVIPCDSSEFLIKNVIDKNTLVIGITQSGETYDTIKALKYAKEKGAKTATIVNVIGSTATRVADISIMMGSGIEISVCATKTYMSQLTILFRLFIEYGKLINKNIGEYTVELNNIPEYIKNVISENNQKLIKNIAENLTVKNYLFISKGVNLPNALEGALKFKEITYLHAEGMSSGFLKHGTISLIDENMDTVVILPPKNSKLHKSVLANIEEIKARNGKVVVIGPSIDINFENYICIPEIIEELSPFVYAPICQLLAYYKAVQLGKDVDKPRGLAKSVTVE